MEPITINDLDFQIGSLNNSQVQVMHTSGKITDETPYFTTDNSFVVKLNGAFVVVKDNAEITEIDEVFDELSSAEQRASDIDELVKKEQSENKKQQQ